MIRESMEVLKREFRRESPVLRHSIRSAFAVAVAVAAANILNLQHGIWLPISVVVIMRPSLGGTLKIGWNRILGTVVGAAVGMGLLFACGFRLEIVLPLILASLFLTLFLKVFNYTAFVIALTALVVLALGVVMPMGWKLGMVRIVDTVLGVGIGVGASFLVWPYRARKNLRKHMGETIDGLGNHFSLLGDHYICGKTSEPDVVPSRIGVMGALESCGEAFREASAEPGLSSGQRQELSRLLRTFSRILDLLSALSTVICRAGGTPLALLADETKSLINTTADYFSWLGAYARNPDSCGEKPDQPGAVRDYLVRIGELRARGLFEDVPMSRRNNVSAFIWHIRAIGEEIDMAEGRIKALRDGRRK